MKQSLVTNGRLADVAYSHIKEKLLRGAYTPGQKLPIDEIALELNASRQPIMDSVKRLAGEGLVEIIPQVGSRVISPRRSEIVDFIRLFISVESMIAELAAQRADDDDKAELRRIVQDFKKVLRDGNLKKARSDAYLKHNRLFHMQIHRMAHSPVVAQIGMSMFDRMDFYISTATPLESRVGAAADEHERIALAIVANDTARARHLSESHLLAFIDQIQST